jgi:hypothetical protein
MIPPNPPERKGGDDFWSYDLADDVAAEPFRAHLALLQSIESVAASKSDNLQECFAWNRYAFLPSIPLLAFAQNQIKREAVAREADALAKYVIDRLRVPFSKGAAHRFALAPQYSEAHLALYRWAKLRGFDQDTNVFLAQTILTVTRHGTLPSGG